MAFVYKAERKIVLADGEDVRNKLVGPGAYQLISDINPPIKNSRMKPPFMTQTGRSGKAGSEYKNNGRHSTDALASTSATYMFFGGGKNEKQQLKAIQKDPSNQSGINQYPSSLGIEMQRATQYTPGPGTYNVTNGFDQINRDMQSAKTLQNFGLDELGIQMFKPNTSFASRVKRFQGISEMMGGT